MAPDALTYLRDLSERRVEPARRTEAQFRVEAVRLALAELQGAVEALVAVGAVEAQRAHRLLAETRGKAHRELMEAGLVSAVAVSATASMQVRAKAPGAKGEDGR